MTHDPRTDPQAGDEVRDASTIRRVIQRDGDILICESWQKRYRMGLDGWRKWCQESSAKASAAVGSKKASAKVRSAKAKAKKQS